MEFTKFLSFDALLSCTMNVVMLSISLRYESCKILKEYSCSADKINTLAENSSSALDIATVELNAS